MAFASRASSVSTAVPDEKVEVWSDLIYNRAKEEHPDTLLTQEDLLGFGVVSDVKKLVPIVTKLVNEYLFKMMTKDGQQAFQWRSEEEAKKYASIPTEEYRIIYELIDNAGTDGLWARSIRMKGGMTELNLKAGLKWLENNGLITDFKSVEQPNKKMFIKSSLRPSERATGGPWFTDGQLDVGFLNSMQQAVFYIIKEQSAYVSKEGRSRNDSNGRAKQPAKGTIRGIPKPMPASLAGTKRVASDISSDLSNDGAPGRLLPLPAGYNNYPTALSIVQMINKSGLTRDPVTKEAVTLSQADMQQVLDILVWENRIEPVRLSGRRVGYCVCRPHQIPSDKREDNDEVLGVAQEPRTNGFSEIPCSSCPVFDICEPGGEVSPATCKYYDEWLKTIT